MADPLLVTAADVGRAAQRLAGRVRRTPVQLSRALGAPIAIKLEHFQRTGAFKLRGATNRLLALDDAARERGVVTASTGNHGMAVATAASDLGVPATVLMSAATQPSIAQGIRDAGATVELIPGDDPLAAEEEARRRHDPDGVTFVSPYNDALVAAGQGTIAVEVLEQLPELGWDGLDVLVVAVGGGGLIGGIAAWMKVHSPATRIVGASPAADAAMLESVAAGTIVPTAGGTTLSHSTAGGVEAEALTFELCRDLVDEWRAVDEAAIAAAVLAMLRVEHQLVEGAAGVALAAAAEIAAEEPEARVMAISCGASITLEELREVLATAP